MPLDPSIRDRVAALRAEGVWTGDAIGIAAYEQHLKETRMTDQYGTVLTRTARGVHEVVNVEPIDDTKLHFVHAADDQILTVDVAEFDSTEDRDAAYTNVVETFVEAGYQEVQG